MNKIFFGAYVTPCDFIVNNLLYIYVCIHFKLGTFVDGKISNHKKAINRIVSLSIVHKAQIMIFKV